MPNLILGFSLKLTEEIAENIPERFLTFGPESVELNVTPTHSLLEI